MSAETQSRPQKPRSYRPRASTVFLAAFIAGAAAAIGVNRVLDVHLAQRQPRVESEPIFVALRSLPPGSPVTVWDVALRDWPKAMLPAAAMRPHDLRWRSGGETPLETGEYEELRRLRERPLASLRSWPAAAGSRSRSPRPAAPL